MDKELKIEGMHCDACKKIITMEIEDLGLQDKLNSVDLSSEANQGFVKLSDVREEDVEKITTAINDLGQYKVIS